MPGQHPRLFCIGRPRRRVQSKAMDLTDEFRAVILALNDAGIPYAVCGGFAVIVYGFPRATQDIDLLVREEDVDRLKGVLRVRGFRLDSGAITFNVGQPRQARVHRLVKVRGDDFLVLDLITFTSRADDPLANRARLDWDGVAVSVVGREELRLLKLDAGRPKDLEDLRKLGLDAT